MFKLFQEYSVELLSLYVKEFKSMIIAHASAKQAAQSTTQLSTCGFIHFADSRADAAGQKIDHAVIGGVVAVVVFAMLCLLIVLGRYFARHKGTTGRQFIV